MIKKLMTFSTRSFLFFLTFFLLFSCKDSDTEEIEILVPVSSRLNIATYNIRFDNSIDVQNQNGWNNRRYVISNLIRYHDFDIFGSQEVLHNQLIDMSGLLAEYNYIGVGREDGSMQGEYSPIFYKKNRFSVLESGCFWLSETPERPSVGWNAALPRICMWGKFEERSSKTILWIFNVHMDHVGLEARTESARLVLSRIEEWCGDETVILLGDFNSTQYEEGYSILNTSDILTDAYQVAELRYAFNGTFNDFDVDKENYDRLDHIFVSGNIQVKRYGILTDAYWEVNEDNKYAQSSPNQAEAILRDIKFPSDHFPVKIEIAFPVE